MFLTAQSAANSLPQNLGLVPELLVDRQVDEEVAQVVDVVAEKHVAAVSGFIDVKRER